MVSPCSNPELADAIELHAAEIERRWLERVRADLSGKSVKLTDLRDGILDYLRHLAEELRRGGSNEARGTRAWVRAAREHGITRVRLGFDIRQLVHEFAALNHTINTVLREHHIAEEAAQRDRVDALMHAAIAESVKTYVDHRDFEARRREAEHVGFITHELRNPLTTAMMAASQLKAHTKHSPDAARALEMLERNQARIRDLIDSVLTAERKKAEPICPRPRDVTLGELLQQGMDTAQREAGPKGLRIETSYSDTVALHLDPDLTASIFTNLIENAIKYTEFGTVSVTVEEHPHEIVLHVRDNCEGISAEELAVLFEPFRRGATSQHGFGLGLSIAKRAAEAQGGTLEAESPGERGCHFWVTLPRRIEARSMESREEDHAAHPDRQ